MTTSWSADACSAVQPTGTARTTGSCPTAVASPARCCCRRGTALHPVLSLGSSAWNNPSLVILAYQTQLLPAPPVLGLLLCLSFQSLQRLHLKYDSQKVHRDSLHICVDRRMIQWTRTR